jgi:NAD/NADP transhydrogenase beta subunit
MLCSVARCVLTSAFYGSCQTATATATTRSNLVALVVTAVSHCCSIYTLVLTHQRFCVHEHTHHCYYYCIATAISGRDQLNMATGLACLAGLGVFTVASPAPDTGLALLGLAGVGSGFLGAHMTASIGGADMPVVRCYCYCYCCYAHLAYVR